MRTLPPVRLTNRGRVACGVVVTAVALAGQSAYSTLFNGHAAATATRVAAPREPSPSATPVSPTPAATPSPSQPAPTGSAPVVVMDRSRDDLPPAVAPSAKPSPTSTASTTTPPTTQKPTPGPGAAEVPPGNGALATVAGVAPAGGKGPLRRYRVQVEGGIGESGSAFAAAVQRMLSDKRSWGARNSFQRVDSGRVAFTVVLASPTLAERLCKPLEIQYTVSCFSGGRSVINLARWRYGVDAYAGKLADYRRYVINHEVGHALGHGHEQCGGAGQLAPVMMQQTKGIGACRPNPWPYPGA